ncbi:hypothetical protein BC6307_07330 [Sutcliffiella cohnii]|uniref:Aminoglycoside phosphotransferase domain-containing protein n=1 Tax=Sutcliffiella cohnii TaxID=33932 RepID=A0A223KP53_9BACI|nr:phosphotransferase [Sutcliffiella cohnii]AST91103.1 hypothetical protein BC6307_07330 [Sutcliffiella cohnii]
MNNTDISLICLNWALDIKDSKILSDRSYLVISTNDERFILKVKGNIAETERENELLYFLESKGLKVQTPLKSKKDELIVTHNNKNFVLYNFIEGEVHSAVHYLQNHNDSNLLGETIAYMHRDLRDVQYTEQFNQKNLYKMVSEFAIKEVFKVDADSNLKSCLECLDKELKNNIESLPRQLIHRDTHIFNFVLNGDKLSAVIDFEIAEVNARLFDVCYCSTSLLNEIFSNIEQRENWFSFVERLFTSYNKVNRLTAEEKDSIYHVMLSIQLIFMAFFSNDVGLYKRNKEMFVWIYTHRDRIQKTVR